MTKNARISDAEWRVMEAVWSLDQPVTANQIVDAIGSADWSPRTVKTMLNRLVKKGVLRFEAEGKRYLYRPAVTRQACVRGEGRSFLKQFFRGELAPMLAHFVEDARLDPQQIKELRKLLDRKEQS